MRLLILSIVISSALINNSASASDANGLSDRRLAAFLNLRVSDRTKVEACDSFRPSSQDSITVAFEYNSSSRAFVMLRDVVYLIEFEDGRTKIAGVARTIGYRKPPNYLSDIFKGSYRNICGNFEVPWRIFYKPLTYYAITPRQGETIIGELYKNGVFKFKKSLSFEWGGPELRFEKLVTEKN